MPVVRVKETTGSTAHSSDVRLDLFLAGRTIPLAQTSGEWIITSEQVSIEVGRATLRVRIDDYEDLREIKVLPHDPQERQIPILRVA